MHPDPKSKPSSATKLLVGLALTLLAGALTLLWRSGRDSVPALDGASGFEPAEVVERAEPAPIPEPSSELAGVSRSPVAIEPDAIVAEEMTAPAPPNTVQPDVVLRGRAFGPEGLLLAEAPLDVYAAPQLVVGSTPSQAGERWRASAPPAFEVSALQANGMLRAPSTSGHLYRLETDADGRFEVRLPAEAREFGARLTFQFGTWRVGARAELELPVLAHTDPDGEELGDIRLVGGERRLIVGGKVLDPEHRPVPGAHVRIMGVRRVEEEGATRLGSGDILRVECDELGSFLAAGVLLEGEATEGLRLYASAQGFAGGSSGPVALGASDVKIVLGRAARLAGRIESGLAEPLPGGLEAVLRWQGEPGVDPFTRSRSALRAEVQPDGSFQFDSLTPHRHAMRFELHGRPQADAELTFLDLELVSGETLEDPRFQPLDLTGRLGVYRLMIESAADVELGPVRIFSGRLTDAANATNNSVALRQVGRFGPQATWLDDAPPLRIELREDAHAPAFLDLTGHAGVDRVRLEALPRLHVRLAGGLPPLPEGTRLLIRHHPFGRPLPLEADGTARLPIDGTTHRARLSGRGYRLELMLERGLAGAGKPKALAPLLGPRDLGPPHGTLEWTVELPEELLRALSRER